MGEVARDTPLSFTGVRTRSLAGRLLRSERGAVAFEFFLVLPLLMSVCLGTFTGGMAYTKKIAMADAVREGVRYGDSLAVAAVTGTTPTTAEMTTWEGKIRDRV